LDAVELSDLRALVLHRHQWVGMRTRVMNGLQGLALAHGIRRRAGLWSRDGQAAITALWLPPHAADRRAELQALYSHLTQQIDELDHRVSAQARKRPQAARLLTHPGVGPVTALATEVFLGDPSRFADGKAVASYVGMIPSEHSSGNRQRLGKITKQGNPLLRLLWCEATIHAVQRDPALRRFYRRKLQQKGFGKARVAAARKLGIRLWIFLRDQIDYAEFCRRASYAWQCGDACSGDACVETWSR
jgi:transposase